MKKQKNSLFQEAIKLDYFKIILKIGKYEYSHVFDAIRYSAVIKNIISYE